MNPSDPAAIVSRLNRRVRTRRAKIALAGRIPFGETLRLHRYRLGNGLTVLLMRDDSAPVLSYHTWFRVGSRHEKPGKTGLAHLFEHLMFNETRNLSAGTFDRTLEAAGGETNAATWVDWTCYYANLPKSGLGLIVRLEADRMANLVLRKPQVASEKEVVANERRFRVEDSVEGTMAEQLFATAFRRHPYGWPTVGWMRDIEGFTVTDCERFYRTYYAPNNAVVVIVGDIDEEETLRALRECYGSIPAARIPPERRVVEPRQRAERRLTLRRPTPSERVSIGFRAPAFRAPDFLALALANEMLFGGRSSRLYRRMVRDEELALEARGSITPFQQPGLYEIWIVVRQGRTADAALAMVDEELGRLRDEEVPPEELEKVKNRSDLGFLQGLETAWGKAERIGFYETVLGDAAEVFRRRDAYQRVSAADIRRAARRAFRRNRRTVVVTLPGQEAGA
jgi:zinc protease